MVGVSPAFFLSRVSEHFGPTDIVKYLPDIASIGGESFQLELFTQEGLNAWTDAAVDSILDASHRYSVTASQFVAHYLLKGFVSPQVLSGCEGEQELERVARIAVRFPSVTTVTIPIPAFDAGGIISPEEWEIIRRNALDKLRRCSVIVGEHGLRLALELIPGNVFGGYASFGLLRNEPGLGSLGVCLDTGLAWAGRERVELLPAILGDAVYATHLKDTHYGLQNALKPGTGDIPWERVLGSLHACGYRGSFDVEFLCGPDFAVEEYAQGITYIRKSLPPIGAEGVHV